jgi:hypothetical protein
MDFDGFGTSVRNLLDVRDTLEHAMMQRVK